MSVLNELAVDPETDMSLWLQLKRQLIWLIASDQLKAGEKLPSVRQLANHLGINLHTVRAAYRKLEADGLVATRHGSGTVVLKYDPIRLSQGVARVRTYTIGVLVPRLSNPFYPAFLRGVENIARQHHSLPWIY
jgi:DNA-binding transcriptional regulator YhcF (GntR family)